MNIFGQRGPSGKESTPGSWFVNGLWVCHTLEDAVREPKGWRTGIAPEEYAAAVAAWKIHGKTAIPSGLYRLTFENSPRFGHDTITVKNVPGFVGVRVHSVSSAADTEGCIGVGDTLDWDHERISGGKSHHVLENLKTMLRGAFKAGEDVWLTITNT